MEEKLRVWWIPQVGIENTFYVEVKTAEDGKKLLDVLACYDLFQLENNIKPDFSNAGGLSVWNEEEQEWLDWYSEDGAELDEYFDGNEEMEEFTENLFSQLENN